LLCRFRVSLNVCLSLFFAIVQSKKLTSTISFYNTCPTTDPASLPFFPGLLVPSLSELQSSTCQSVFAAKVDCLALNYSVPGVSGSQFFSAADLPTNGTAAISDLPGSITSPPGGETMTWQFQSGNVVTVTAAPYTGIAAVASTSTAAGSESSVTTSGSTTMSTGTETSTGSAATSSATKASFAVPSSPRVGRLLGEMLVLALGFCVL
jgi:hypothetical protein